MLGAAPLAAFHQSERRFITVAEATSITGGALGGSQSSSLWDN